MLKTKIDFVKKWTFASPISVQIDEFWPYDDKCFQNGDSSDFSTPLEPPSKVDDFRSQVYQNWMKNGWVISNFVKRVSIIVQLLPNYCQKCGNYLSGKVCQFSQVVKHGRLCHHPKFEMKWIENKPFTAYNLFKYCKSVTKFSLVTWPFGTDFKDFWGFIYKYNIHFSSVLIKILVNDLTCHTRQGNWHDGLNLTKNCHIFGNNWTIIGQ